MAAPGPVDADSLVLMLALAGFEPEAGGWLPSACPDCNGPVDLEALRCSACGLELPPAPAILDPDGEPVPPGEARFVFWRR